MILSNIKGITIPEGAVKQIADRAGRVLWKGGVDVAALMIGYTGDYTDQPDVVMSDGKTYRLLTLTGSGTLTLDAAVKADVWLCAGGNGGRKGGYHGGGGGNFVQADGVELDLSTVCIIGAGATQNTSSTASSTSTAGIGGSTTFGELEVVQALGTVYPEGSTSNGTHAVACGASGGGAGGLGTSLSSVNRRGLGCGESTVPFLETDLFDPHSAGGGGGANRDREDSIDYSGGMGGSDGADGSSRSGTGYDGGAAGEKGGGAGGAGSSSSSTNKGGDATYYGSGGGGGGHYVSTTGTETKGNAGSGYQGVIYVRIPYEQ